MSDDDEDSDQDEDHAVVETPRSIWQMFVQGSNRLAQAACGVCLGAWAANGVFVHGARVAVDAMPSGPRHIFWLGVAAFAAMVLFIPDKRISFYSRGIGIG